ncbi:hypothetical protein ACFQT0_07300 [Hymenobacter humi]|uniref:Uncharacterized protein n=1 Tax=Hymenobacter humi TaxID=1411620 RepID=A0ABW2U324_9BACT
MDEQQMATVKYKDWELIVDKELTEATYKKVAAGGADDCTCSNCKNYVAYREQVFPDEVLELFSELGVDYRRDVEIVSYEVLPNGNHHIGGWFHFKGRILAGDDCRLPLPSGGYSLKLKSITGNFSIGFAESSDLTWFKDKAGLVQIEFETIIPWVIDKSLEDSN